MDGLVYTKKAVILLNSRAITRVVSEAIEFYQLEPVVYDSPTRLIEDLTSKSLQVELIFFSKNLPGADGDSLQFVKSVRDNYGGPLLLISSEEDVANIEHFVECGVTDVFSPNEISQVISFISTYTSYRQTLMYDGKQTVLLVEDNMATARVISKSLEDIGIEVLHVITGREALTVLHFEKVDLVLVDFILEGDMTGTTLVRNVRRTSQWHSLPILAITGYTEPVRHLELLRTGVADVISKPVELSILQIKCKNWINSKRTFDLLMSKQAALLDIAHRDELTGLHNRAHLYEKIEEILKRSILKQTPLALMMLDIDHFKSVNDNYGHEFGDRVLQRIADCMRHNTRVEDILVRMGGEEFAIILENCPMKDAENKADKILADIRNANVDGVHVTSSLGLLCQIADGVPFSEFYKAADKALYDAKEGGRDRYVIAS